MYISYKKGNNGRIYASVMESAKVDGRSVKTSVLYLGQVVDAEKGIYRSRDRGTFTYDLETGIWRRASSECLTGRTFRSRSGTVHPEPTWISETAIFSTESWRPKGSSAASMRWEPVQRTQSPRSRSSAC